MLKPEVVLGFLAAGMVVVSLLLNGSSGASVKIGNSVSTPATKSLKLVMVDKPLDSFSTAEGEARVRGRHEFNSATGEHVITVCTTEVDKKSVFFHEVGHLLFTEMGLSSQYVEDLYCQELFAETFALTVLRVGMDVSGLDREMLESVVQVNMMETYRNHMRGYGITRTEPSKDEVVFHAVMYTVLSLDKSVFYSTLKEYATQFN